MNKLFCTAFFSLFVFFSQAQATLFTSKDSLNAFCDKVMKTLTERKFSEAIQLFRKKSVLDTATINNIDKNLVEQMVNLQPYYKKIVEYEFVEEKAIKNSVVLRRYLLKFENYFLTVDFILYNNRSGWTISNFNYYDNPKELF
ncbi:MAG: hypothetical protein ABIN74_12830 [Ferruginibacter sp.]